MKANKLKIFAAAIILTASVTLTGCGSLLQQTLEILQNNATTSDVSTTDGADKSITNSAAGNTSTNGTKLSLSEIEELAATSVYGVEWYTKDDTFSAGTSFLIDSNAHGKVMVSALHFLQPDGTASFNTEELASYVIGGSIYNIKDFSETGASLKNCVMNKNANTNTSTANDMSAFTIQNGDNLNTLPLSTHKLEKGDKVYLLANLWDTDDIHENCVYEATVISEMDGTLSYELDTKYGTAGASGAPVVNEYGEVAAIHIGSIGSTRIGNGVSSFSKLIENGTLSDITYEAINNTEADNGEDCPTYTLNLEDTMSTLFFNLKVNSVTVTDVLNSYTASPGKKFVVLNVSMEALDATPVAMYYSDFAMIWEDNYDYPLEPGYLDTQFADEYTINGTITGDMVFEVPADTTEALFDYADYYTTEDSSEPHYIGYYEYVIPMENWSGNVDM